MAIRIDKTRAHGSYTHKDRQESRYRVAVAGRIFETEGANGLYKLLTLLWLDGLEGEPFEVWDDKSPFGAPGGLAITGRVRNYGRLVKERPVFDRKAKTDPKFTGAQRHAINRAAGRVEALANAVE